MKLPVVVLVAASVLSIHAVFAAEDEAPLPESVQATLLDPQNDLNCKSYGFFGAMYADRKSKGMSREKASADVMGNYNRLEIPTEKDRLAKEFILAALPALAEIIYAHGELKAETVEAGFPFLCLAGRVGPVPADARDAFFRSSVWCQDYQPSSKYGLVPEDAHSKKERIRTCLAGAAHDLVLEVLKAKPE